MTPTRTPGNRSEVVPSRARLIVEPLQLTWTAAQAAGIVRGDRHPFVLSGCWADGGALIGSEPLRVAAPGADPFVLLDDQPVVAVDDRAPANAVGGGWFGLLGFALARQVESLPPAPPAGASLPPFALAFYDHLLHLDADGRWWFEALWTPARAGALAARRDALLARHPVARPFAAGPFTSAPPGAAGMRVAVAECVRRIAVGELYQANLTLHLRGAFTGDPLDAFAAAVDALDPCHGAYLAGPWGATIGLSPELFLRRRGRDVVTRPIKGTIRRDTVTPETARDALIASAKDRAENVMIVDLMRNDLGRVCEYGSIQADREPVAEAHPGVWHLVSDVRGRLRDGVDDAALLRATFPPGSVTGAPKVQALRVISELEGISRHAYTGAVGFASPVAGLELSVVIRTFEVRDGVAWVGAGGGIVADSTPDGEVREALVKARPLVAALGSRIDPDARLAGRIPTIRALDGRCARPDPSLGLIETIAVRDGRPVDLDGHLARLRASVAEILDAQLPVDLSNQALATARRVTAPIGRLRIDVVRRPDDTLAVQLALAAATPVSPSSAALIPVLLPGGLGAHKWRDRRLVETLQRRHRAIPLFVDSDGAVLEAASANIWLIEGDALITPPADGRLLAGITRDRLLTRLGAREQPIDLDRLQAADGVLLTSSIALLRAASGPIPDPVLIHELREMLARDIARRPGPVP